MADFLSGALNGFMSMFGIGPLYDKMGDLSSQLKQIQEKTTSLTSTNSLLFATDVVSGMETLRELNGLTSKQQELLIQQTNTFINDNLQRQNLFILFVCLLFFIFIFFFLIQKKCC